ncbi:MAG TPA: tripartite tricarboxylate transporter TctB family protein [Candidatus Avidesulfovibrio excrementigallinarum]|nr:tripartite tricarboxylate transporter TctB family protein [Candidatus Avidesulfovibrio excrementigallinarum]
MTRLSSRSLWLELGISLALTGLFLYAYLNMESWVIETMPSTISPAFFPTLTAQLLFWFSLILVGVTLWVMFYKKPGTADNKRKASAQTTESTGRVFALIGYIAIMFLYLIGMHYVGFVISTPLIMLAVALLLGIRRWIIGFVCYVAFTLALDYAAFHFMQIILPSGVLFH